MTTAIWHWIGQKRRVTPFDPVDLALDRTKTGGQGLGEDGDELLPRPRLAQIIEIQRELAAEHGCGFWDGIAFMGGVGSMARWATSERPLARDDDLHFTRHGAVRKGMALSDALMLEYDWAAGRTK